MVGVKTVVGIILVFAVVLLFAIKLPGAIIEASQNIFGMTENQLESQSDSTDMTPPITGHSDQDFYGGSSASDVSSLSPGELLRERKSITKTEYKQAIKEACTKHLGECTLEQQKALYGITIIERGGLNAEKITAYHWNFGNLVLPRGKTIYLRDMGLSEDDYGKKFDEYYAKLKEYIDKKGISVREDAPYYWGFDKDGSGKPYFIQWQAFATPAEGLASKIKLIRDYYPDAIDKNKLLNARNDPEAMGRIVANGLYNGKPRSDGSIRRYFLANPESYASGVTAGIKDFEKN